MNTQVTVKVAASPPATSKRHSLVRSLFQVTSFFHEGLSFFFPGNGACVLFRRNRLRVVSSIGTMILKFVPPLGAPLLIHVFEAVLNCRCIL